MNKRKIAFICAHPTGLNPGMLSVDLAAIQLLERASADKPIEWSLFNTEAHGSICCAGYPFITYKYLEEVDQLNEFDRIVFWGDFTHWLLYATKEWAPRFMAKNSHTSQVDAIKKWLHLFFLRGQSDLLKKVIVFGSTFYGLTAQQLAIDPYLAVMQKMYSNCLLAMPRDMYSTIFINHLTASSKASLGCDCAFLLNQHEFLAKLGKILPNHLKSSVKNEALPYMILALGRTKSLSLLTHFSNLVARKLGVEVVVLPWLVNNGIQGLGKSLKLIAKADFVFTDVYHCAVTALREGKSTIAYGASSFNPNHSLSDNKKEVLMRQHLFGSNYISVELISRAIIEDRATSELVDHVVEIVKNQKSRDIGSSLLSNHIKSSMDSLSSVLLGNA